jgi:hypothetical protein
MGEITQAGWIWFNLVPVAAAFAGAGAWGVESAKTPK